MKNINVLPLTAERLEKLETSRIEAFLVHLIAILFENKIRTGILSGCITIDENKFNKDELERLVSYAHGIGYDIEILELLQPYTSIKSLKVVITIPSIEDKRELLVIKKETY